MSGPARALPVGVLLLMSLFAAAPCFAQFETASVVGTVKDTSGAVTPDTTVTLTNTATGVSLTRTTNGNGVYEFTTVRPGAYVVTAQKAGFAVALVDGVQVEVAARQRIDLQMAVGEVSDKVEVTATAPLIDTDSSQRGQVDATLSRILGPKIDLRMRLATTGGIVRAAPVELEGILLNLVARARDAMPDGGVVTIETSSFELGADADEPREEPRRYVRLSVSDSPHGIAANERTPILDPLFTSKEKGTGLGLHGVNLVVQRLNGLLRIESQAGVGTQVHVCLPLALQESGF